MDGVFFLKRTIGLLLSVSASSSLSSSSQNSLIEATSVAIRAKGLFEPRLSFLSDLRFLSLSFLTASWF